jgi:hypothetical protein
MIPLLIAIGIVPLVVFLHVMLVPPEYRHFWVSDYVFDFFSYYKARIVIACASFVVVAAIVLYFLGWRPHKKSALLIPLAVYAAMLVVSTIASKHPLIALGGFFDRAEGMWVLLAYIVLMVGTYLFVSDVVHAWRILAVWAAALCVICVLGLFQFFSLDFFSSMFGRLLILPTQYRQIAPLLHFNFPRYIIYSTLFNPNNVASMMAMVFPIAAACFILTRSLKRQVAFGILAGLLYLTLLGSNGRAGWVAALVALLLIVVFLIWRGVAALWKRLGILALVIVVGFGSLNYFSGSALGKRAGSLLVDMEKTLESGTSQNDAGETSSQPDTHVDEEPVMNAQEGLAEQLIRKYGTVVSGRGYTWIRSLQMSDDTILLGHGPDTFALYFPNTDPYKAYYNEPQTFIDKPHNMYLQSWLNLGGIATLAFLVMVIMHCVHTFKILKQAKPTSDQYMLALGLFFGWFAYLLAAFFYDSAVSVAPSFWIVFGLSMAMNKMLEAKNSR